MENLHRNQSENEYRLYLLARKQSNPAAYETYLQQLRALAQTGYSQKGRGVVLIVDDGGDGVHCYIPGESADQQFGTEIARLCETYDPAQQWLLVAMTDGRIFPILME